MPAERFELRISASRLLIGLLVIIIPISIAGLYSLAHSDRALESALGSNFKAAAETTASGVAQFIHDRVVDVGIMTVNQSIIDAVTASNRKYQGMSETAINERLAQLDKEWNTPAAEGLVTQVLSMPASRHLRRRQELDRRFLRITVTDARGAVAAATHKTIDYNQSDEEFWQSTYANGRGAMNLTDILYDDVTKSNYIGVGAPVLEEGTNRFIGVVDALVDVSSLFPIVNRAHAGPAMLLVKDDGTVIAAPDVTLSMNRKAVEFPFVQDALRTPLGVQDGYVVADLASGRRALVGFADTGLKRDYRNLGWLALVSQDTRDAFAPIRAVARTIALMSLLALAGVAILAVYVSLHRNRPFAEIGDLRQPSRAASA